MDQPQATPTPQYTPRRRSLFGPFLLILMGGLFLLKNLGMIHASFSQWFANWWPLLLILWGIMRLVDWSLARKANAPPPCFGAGSVILIIFFVLFGLAVSAIHNTNWDNTLMIDNNDDMPEFFTHFVNAHEFNENVQQEFTPGALVRVNNMQGDITVSTSPDTMIHVAARNTVYGSDENANRLEAEAKPTITREGDVFVVRGSNSNRVHSNLQIQLPQKATLDLSTDHGKISVTGILGNVQAHTGHGDVSLENLGGDASIEIHGDLVSAHKVQGAISVTGRIETVDVSDAGSVDVGGEYLGSMTVERIQKAVHFHSPRSEMAIENVRGRVVIDRGEVEGNDIGGPIQLRTEAKNIHLEDFSGDLSIQDSDGEIKLEPKKLGTINVVNRNEAINLLLPDNANATIAARTTGEGEISSDFSSLKPQSSGSGTHLTGNVGAGGPTVTLTTDNAAIEIRKSTTTAAK